MEKWEHGMLGWYLESNRGPVVYYWRLAGQDNEFLEDARGVQIRLGELGGEGWELAAVTTSDLNGETMYFKRRSSE